MAQPSPQKKLSLAPMLRTAAIILLVLLIALDAIGLFASFREFLSREAYHLSLGRRTTIPAYSLIKYGAILLLVVLVVWDTRARNSLIALLAPASSKTRWLAAIALITIFLLSSQGLLDPLQQVLNQPALSMEFGTYSLSIYKALKALILIWTMLWIASLVISLGEARLRSMERVKASNRALLIKLLQIFIYVLVFFIALSVLGIDIRALTVFSGAVGIGLGFGLQKIASNFVSGLILLFEKSVEESDLVDLGNGVFGFVRQTGARYTLIETHDSREIMVPNEDFITNRVTNWTFSDCKGRIEIPVGIAYDSDIEKARELMLTAAKEHPRCILEPAPQCFLRNFGESSIDFLVHFWVDDVENGRMAPQSDVMRHIWRLFKENDITIPFPQRDLYIKEGPGLTP